MAKKSYKFHRDRKKNDFLNLYIQHGSITRAMDALGMQRQSHYRWLKEDERYRQAFEEAYAMGADRIEEEAMRRAVEGYEKKVYGKDGAILRSEVVYSDHLLGILLKGRKPEYRESAEVKTEVNLNVSDAVAQARARIAHL